jgi:hypothetical protein
MRLFVAAMGKTENCKLFERAVIFNNSRDGHLFVLVGDGEFGCVFTSGHREI